MLTPSSFFLANPLRWALLGVREVGRAFRLDGLRHIFVSKSNNHSQIHRCQVQSSFGEAEKRPDDEKAAGNTLCIGKAFEDVWAFFLPVKTVCVLVNRGYCYSLKEQRAASCTAHAAPGMGAWRVKRIKRRAL